MQFVNLNNLSLSPLRITVLTLPTVDRKILTMMALEMFVMMTATMMESKMTE